jgi:nucleotide-binding universal stress UspA family protein
MFDNILLPLDGSHSCLRARELVCAFAKKFGSKITVIHVISHDFMHPELKASYELPPLVLNELDKTYKKAGEKIIKAAAEFFNEENIKIQTILVKAEDPAERILQKAKELECDLIVMGNIAERPAFRYSLGSVADKVSLHAPCSVLIVKKKTIMNKLLVAFDSSKEAINALKSAVNLCKHFDSTKLTILNVENRELHKLEPAIAKKVGEQILEKTSPLVDGVTCDNRLEYGKPAETILKVAKMDDYDLVVLGSRGLGSVRRFLTGSVSTYVSMNAERSVLIVR